MGGLRTLDSASAADTYAALSDLIESCDGDVSIYSRLPMRQILRYVASNKAELWWVSEHQDARAVGPDVSTVEHHINANIGHSPALLVVEGVDWLVARSGAQEVLAWLQRLDRTAVEHNIDVVLPVDSLSVETQVWRRIASLAPALENPLDADVGHLDEHTIESLGESSVAPGDAPSLDDEQSVTHLVHLPLEGFTKSLLSKRMLQWKRMGFDLATLEPALAMSDMNQVHALYASVESTIVLAIDGLRLMERHREKMSVTEREMFNYRMMSLMDVEDHISELEAMISSR
jgi:hypothetical protein